MSGAEQHREFDGSKPSQKPKAARWSTQEDVGSDTSAGPDSTDVIIDGAELLDKCLAFVLRFVIPPSEAAGIAMVTWAAHTHLIDAFETTPRLAFLSAEPGSGKSRAMEIVSLLCPLAIETSNASSAALMSC